MSKYPETVTELFPSKWLKADDLSKPVTIAIESTQFEQVYDRDERGYVDKLTIQFHGAQKRMIPNKTQCEAIWQITQTERFSDWAGHMVTLAPGIARNKKPTIVVSRPQNNGKQPPLADMPETMSPNEIPYYNSEEA